MIKLPEARRWREKRRWNTSETVRREIWEEMTWSCIGQYCNNHKTQTDTPYIRSVENRFCENRKNHGKITAKKVQFIQLLICQGCKRDVEVRDRDETETFGFQSETRPRPRPSHFSRDRDRDVWFWVRDETETETLIGRDRDIFRDLGMLSYIWIIFNIFASRNFF